MGTLPEGNLHWIQTQSETPARGTGSHPHLRLHRPCLFQVLPRKARCLHLEMSELQHRQGLQVQMGQSHRLPRSERWRPCEIHQEPPPQSHGELSQSYALPQQTDLSTLYNDYLWWLCSLRRACTRLLEETRR